MEKEQGTIVSLHGSYFCNNYGDLLLINLFYKWIKEADPNVIVNLPMAYDKTIKELPEGTLRGIKNLCKSRCLVYCGGGYFGEQPRHKLYWSCRNFYRHLIIGIIAIIKRIPIAIIGVEFGPLSISWFRKSVIWLAKRSKVIVVRNQESLDFLSKFGVNNVVLGVDGVLSLKPEVQQERSYQQPNILLHLPNIQFAEEKYIGFTQEIIRRMLELGWTKVSFIEDSDAQYETGYDKYFSLFSDAGINYDIIPYISVEKLIDTIRHADYVVTTKLHIGITAASLNVPVLSFYNHPKVIRLHKQIGNEKNCISVNASSNDFSMMVNRFFPSQFELPESIRRQSELSPKLTKEFIINTTR